MSTSRIQEFLSTVPVITKTLLLFNVSVHILMFLTSYPVNTFAINPFFVIFRGEYYRLISSAFIHGGIMHIFMNMSSLLAIGSSIEKSYGSIKFLFITLWALVLSGIIFVSLVWLYANATSDLGSLNTSAVGYSGVLFSYALIECYHSLEISRSVFGFFSVPTKAYPFILLIVLQFIMPNISWWGHLSGLLVGLILISRIGIQLFMPSNDFLQSIEDYCFCCRSASLPSYSNVMAISSNSGQLSNGYVTLRTDKDLIHPYLDYNIFGNSSNSSSNNSSIMDAVYYGATQCWRSVCFIKMILYYILTFVWNIIATVLHIIGIPTANLEAYCQNILSHIYSALASVSSGRLCADLYDYWFPVSANTNSNFNNNANSSSRVIHESDRIEIGQQQSSSNYNTATSTVDNSAAQTSNTSRDVANIPSSSTSTSSVFAVSSKGRRLGGGGGDGNNNVNTVANAAISRAMNSISSNSRSGKQYKPLPQTEESVELQQQPLHTVSKKKNKINQNKTNGSTDREINLKDDAVNAPLLI